MGFKQRAAVHYQFIKPGIVHANVLMAAAGYLFANRLSVEPLVLLSLILGLGLLIIGACAANNIIDRRRDEVMKRTASRGLVAGTLGLSAAYSWAIGGAVVGILLLVATQNTLTVLLALVAYIDYVVLYSLAKRRTVHSTLIGCVSGALPLVAGYTAVTGTITVTAVLLFVLMTAWQMAHFFGIALYRLQDYTRADFPVMPVRRGAETTKRQAVVYVCVFLVAVVGLIIGGELGLIGGIVLLGVGLWWLVGIIRNYTQEASLWGKQLFLRSLVVMLGMTLGLAGGSWLY